MTQNGGEEYQTKTHMDLSWSFNLRSHESKFNTEEKHECLLCTELQVERFVD